MGESARRAGGGRPAQPDGSHGQYVRLPRCRAAPPAFCDDLGCVLSPSQMGEYAGGREGAVRRSRTEATVQAASSALSRGPSGALRHLPAAARQGGGERGHVKDLHAARVAHAPCLAGPGVRRAGRWRGARAGGPGTVWVWEFRLPTLGTLRGAGWTGGLASGDCPPSAGCRTRRLMRVTPARRAPPTRTRRARAHPTRPRTLRFSSPRRQTPARPTHATASGADPGRPPTPRGRGGLCARPEG